MSGQKNAFELTVLFWNFKVRPAMTSKPMAATTSLVSNHPFARRSRMASPVRLEFQFDFGSPNAYLADAVIPAIERRHGVKFDYVPVLLGGIYKATGNMSPGESLRG